MADQSDPQAFDRTETHNVIISRELREAYEELYEMIEGLQGLHGVPPEERNKKHRQICKACRLESALARVRAARETQ